MRRTWVRRVNDFIRTVKKNQKVYDRGDTVTAVSYYYNCWDNDHKIQFVGVARRDGNDSCDFEKAKNIALSKMERQAFKFLKQDMLKKVKEIEENYEDCLSALSKIRTNISVITDHIIDLAYSNENEESNKNS